MKRYVAIAAFAALAPSWCACSSRQPASAQAAPAPSDNRPIGFEECPLRTPVLAKSGGEVTLPNAAAMRFELVYKGHNLGVRVIKPIEATSATGDGPFTPAKTTGYWVELRDASNRILFTRKIVDPSHAETPRESESDPQRRVALEMCAPKAIFFELPQVSGATQLVMFGSPYGTDSPAEEIGRFTLRRADH